jgi:hypothetical protein|tara:strand:+ start:4695 stop:4967 length:273 start_codon:yes stop_codon:yes gene_type:complete
MKRISFKYDNAKNDSTPEVLVTTQNQHMVRGFNTNYMTKGQATRIQNEWRKIQNQRWSTATKERVLMNRVGSPAKNSFRMYRTEGIAYTD